MKKALPMFFALAMVIVLLALVASAAGSAAVQAGGWAAALGLMIFLGIGLIMQDRRNGLF